MSGEEIDIEADDPDEFPETDLEVEIHEAILAREKTGDSFPDEAALEIMDEPLDRLTGRIPCSAISRPGT